MTWKRSIQQGAEQLLAFVAVIAALAVLTNGVGWLWGHGLADALSGLGWGVLYGYAAVVVVLDATKSVWGPIAIMLSLVFIGRTFSQR